MSKMEEKDANLQGKKSNLCINQGLEFKLGFCECSLFSYEKIPRIRITISDSLAKDSEMIPRLERDYSTQK